VNQILEKETNSVMKTRSTIVAGLIVMLSTVFFASHAQSNNPTIKVLPTTKDGIVKLLVVGAADESVDVRIYSEEGLAATDAINSKLEGFNKKYDVREIMNRGFLMEVTSAGTSVTYKLAKSKGKLIPYLVKTTFTYPIVASND
jgi:hypothetical protein